MNRSRNIFLAAGPFLALLLATIIPGAPASAQEGLQSLYGSKNIQTITARWLPTMLPDHGTGGELMFGFNTLSRRSEFQEGWKYFYGVGLGGGGVSWLDSELGELDPRQGAVGYGLLQLEGKLFATDEGDMRPYLGGHLGLGSGSYWLEQIDDEPELPAGSLNLYTGGLEAGLHLKISRKYWLTASIGAELMVFGMGSETELSYPAVVTVGLARWRGPMP